MTLRRSLGLSLGLSDPVGQAPNGVSRAALQEPVS